MYVYLSCHIKGTYKLLILLFSMKRTPSIRKYAVQEASPLGLEATQE